jgi:protein-S-isoprenylcysteine O-methyltransferase Ste14
MHGEYSRSLGQKTLLTALHAAALGFSAWILFDTGLDWFASFTHRALIHGPLLHRVLVFACAVIYFARSSFAVVYLIKRAMDWGEALGVGLFIGFVDIIFAFLGASNTDPFAALTLLGMLLYLAGSCVTTGAELQREFWKQNPAHTGQLFTGGLFRYARHINYFGEEVLFFGYAMVVGSPWAFIVPLLMAAGFIFVNIPTLDAYLKKKYGFAFESYAARTKKFIPYVW